MYERYFSPGSLAVADSRGTHGAQLSQMMALNEALSEELAEVKKQTELDTSFSPTHLATMRQELDHLRSGYSEVRR